MDVSAPADTSSPRFYDRARNRESSSLEELVRDAQTFPELQYLALLTVGARFPDARLTTYVGIEARYQPPVLDSLVADARNGSTVAEAARSLRGALDNTLDRLLAGVRCAAVLTGGGLDSGGLLALVHAWAARNGKKCFAVAIDFESPGDDRPYLRALEKFLPCRVVRVRPEEGAAFFGPAFYEGVDHAPLPAATVPFEMAAYSRATNEGADCLLTGVGGDQLFDGVPRSLAHALRNREPRVALSGVRDLRGFPRPRYPSFEWILRPLLVEALPRFIRARIVRPAPFPSVEWSGPAFRASRAKEVRRRRREVQDLVRYGPAIVSNDDLVIARHAQQMIRATGVPRRVDPYTDPSLKSFVHRLPRHWLLAGNVRRGLFREALRNVLPSALYTRLDKAAFEPAMIRLVHSIGGFDALRPFSEASMLASLGIIEPAPFRAEFERFVANPTSGHYWPRVWPVLALEAFVRHHFARYD